MTAFGRGRLRAFFSGELPRLAFDAGAPAGGEGLLLAMHFVPCACGPLAVHVAGGPHLCDVVVGGDPEGPQLSWLVPHRCRDRPAAGAVPAGAAT